MSNKTDFVNARRKPCSLKMVRRDNGFAEGDITVGDTEHEHYYCEKASGREGWYITLRCGKDDVRGGPLFGVERFARDEIISIIQAWEEAVLSTP